MDNFLLLLFALPLATIIISSVFEIIFKNPIAIGALCFAIYLIVAFAAFDASFLIYAILYTILAFVSAFLTRAVLNAIDKEETSDDETENTVNDNTCMSSCNCRYRNYR